MEYVIGFFITGLLFLLFFFLVVYGVLALIIGKLAKPLTPIIKELKNAWDTASKASNK